MSSKGSVPDLNYLTLVLYRGRPIELLNASKHVKVGLFIMERFRHLSISFAFAGCCGGNYVISRCLHLFTSGTDHGSYFSTL